MQEKFREECLNTAQEARRIQKEFDASLKSLADLETKLFHARRLIERESKLKRFKGTLGKNIDYVSNDSTAGKEEQAIHPIAKLNSGTHSVSSLLSQFNTKVAQIH